MPLQQNCMRIILKARGVPFEDINLSGHYDEQGDWQDMIRLPCIQSRENKEDPRNWGSNPGVYLFLHGALNCTSLSELVYMNDALPSSAVGLLFKEP